MRAGILHVVLPTALTDFVNGLLPPHERPARAPQRTLRVRFGAEAAAPISGLERPQWCSKATSAGPRGGDVDAPKAVIHSRESTTRIGSALYFGGLRFSLSRAAHGPVS